jgi:hypothetical protein
MSDQPASAGSPFATGFSRWRAKRETIHPPAGFSLLLDPAALASGESNAQTQIATAKASQFRSRLKAAI